MGGIVAWFVLLLVIVAKYRERFHPESLDRVVRWIGWGVIAAAFGVLAVFLRDTFLL
jgi:hypothetical protein